MGLKDIVEREAKSYAVTGLNVRVIFTQNEPGDEFVLTAYAKERGQSSVYTSLYVALTDRLVLVYEDRNDPPFVESLMQAGVPREKIILLYAGEEAPVKG